jgi:hypothetical protein
MDFDVDFVVFFAVPVPDIWHMLYLTIMCLARSLRLLFHAPGVVRLHCRIMTNLFWTERMPQRLPIGSAASRTILKN